MVNMFKKWLQPLIYVIIQINIDWNLFSNDHLDILAISNTARLWKVLYG